MLGECAHRSLVWDYRSGSVVCSECGLVVDTLVYAGAPTDGRTAARLSKLRASEFNSIRSSPYAEFRKILRCSARLNSGELYLDDRSFEEYLRGKRGAVKLLVSEKSARAMRLAASDSRIRDLIDNFIRKVPRLNSRTERAKVALAMLMLLIGEGVKIDGRVLREVSAKTNTSLSHVRRLYSLLSVELKSRRVFEVRALR